MATLQLVNFEVDESESGTDLVFRVKGPAKLLPDSVSHKAAGKGLREVRVAEDAKTALYNLGEVVDVTGDPKVDEEDEAYFDWWKDNFVLESLGGGYNEEDAEPDEDEDDADADADEDPEDEEDDADEDEDEDEDAEDEDAEDEEDEFSLDAWTGTADDWDEAEAAINALKANEVKDVATRIGAKPGSSKAKTVEAIKAHVFRFVDALKTVATAKTFITENAADEDSLKALYETERTGKGRASILKAVDEAIKALQEPKAKPEKAPKAAAKPEKAPKAAAKSEKPAKAPKAPKAPKAEAKGKKPRKTVEDEDEKHADEIEAVCQAIGPQVASLVRTIGAKGARTALTRLVGRINPDTGAISAKDGKGETGGNFALFFVPGRTLSVTKRHKGDWGTCEYNVLCREDGQYEIESVNGNRPDLAKLLTAKAKSKDQHVFKTAKGLLQALTGKDNPGTMLYRWFGLEG